MADSENDNLENLDDDDLENNEKDDDGKFEYYDFDDNTMYTTYLKSSSEAPIKIDKVADYYELFVRMLKTEDAILHTREHFALRPFREGFRH